MARTVNQQAHATKSGEILDAALQLVSTEGYERMAIQDLLDTLQISKGAFYHYFDSKRALLEALVSRMLLGAEDVLTPLAEDSRAPAPEALERFFAGLAHYKASQKPFIVSLLPVWYADENAIVRDKVRDALIDRLRPLVARIVRRGCSEGVFRVTYPDDAARIVLGLTQDLADRLARTLLRPQHKADLPPSIPEMVAATGEAVERVLAARPGSIRLAGGDTLATWFSEPENSRS